MLFLVLQNTKMWLHWWRQSHIFWLHSYSAQLLLALHYSSYVNIYIYIYIYIKLLCSHCFLIKKNLFFSSFLLISRCPLSLSLSLLRLPLLSSSSFLHLCWSTAHRLVAQLLAISSTHLANPQTHLPRPISFLSLLKSGFGWLGFFMCVWLIFGWSLLR